MELTLVTMAGSRVISKHDGKQEDQYDNLQGYFKSVYILEMWDGFKN